MKRLLIYLKQPYPFHENNWSTIIVVSLFVSLFLIVFKPFGSDGIAAPARFYILGGYGVVTFLVLIVDLIILPVFFKKYFNDKYWTVGINVIWLIWILFTIGLANYFYTLWFFDITGIWWHGLLIVQFFTLSVGFFPVTAITILTYHRLKHKNQLAAVRINSHLQPMNQSSVSKSLLTFTSENEKNAVTINSELLIYITSEGNYCTLFCISAIYHNPVILATTSLSKILSPKYLLFSL